MKLAIIDGKPYIAEDKDSETVLTPAKDGIYTVKSGIEQLRTYKQNRAMHLYFKMLAEALNDAGYDIKETIKADVPWTETSVKELIWRPIQQAITGKKSTTSIKKSDIDMIFDVINKNMGEKRGVSVPFPSEEEIRIRQNE